MTSGAASDWLEPYGRREMATYAMGLPESEDSFCACFQYSSGAALGKHGEKLDAKNLCNVPSDDHSGNLEMENRNQAQDAENATAIKKAFHTEPCIYAVKNRHHPKSIVPTSQIIHNRSKCKKLLLL
jgi:hypothetical protein